MLPYTDTHAHLSLLGERGIDAHSRLEQLFSSGFGSILDIGTKSGDLSPRMSSFARYPAVGFSAGIWPSPEAIEHRGRQMEELGEELAHTPKGRVLAIGEAGLDRYWNKVDADGKAGSPNLRGERELFEAQAALARTLSLPLIVHSRDAPGETLEVLQGFPGLTALIHCFSYGKEEARAFLDLGCWISFSGTVTFKNAGAQREAAAFIPDDRLLLETDAPYLAPVPLRGTPADPGMVQYSYREVARCRGMAEENLVALVCANAQRLFGWQPPASAPRAEADQAPPTPLS